MHFFHTQKSGKRTKIGIPYKVQLQKLWDAKLQELKNSANLMRKITEKARNISHARKQNGTSRHTSLSFSLYLSIYVSLFCLCLCLSFICVLLHFPCRQ
jgi:hypothetical protein